MFGQIVIVQKTSPPRRIPSAFVQPFFSGLPVKGGVKDFAPPLTRSADDLRSHGRGSLLMTLQLRMMRNEITAELNG